MKKWYIAIIISFFLPIAVLSLVSAFDTDPTESVSEKRRLAALPDFSARELFSGELIPKFEEYYNDAFPFRESLLSVNTELNRLYYFSPVMSDEQVVLEIPQNEKNITAGGEALVTETPSPSPTPRPPVAPEQTATPEPTPTPEPLPELDNPDADLNTGVIIIVGDRAMEVCTGNNEVMQKYAAAVNSIGRQLPDVRVINLVTPNGSAFYAPESYRTGSHDQQEIISTVYSYLDEAVVSVDAYSEIRKHVDEYLYFRTDHHWTQLGAYYAYVAFCESLELEPVPLDDFEQGSIDSFVGSMYSYTSGYPQSKALKDNPDTLHYYRPTRSFSARVYPSGKLDESQAWNGAVIASKVANSNKYLCFISGDNPVMKITSDVANGKKIVVVKESYGNAFVPFLVNHYEEVYVVDPRKFSGKDTPSIDIVEFSERVGANDLLVIDYPLVVSSQGYVNILNNIIP